MDFKNQLTLFHKDETLDHTAETSSVSISEYSPEETFAFPTMELMHSILPLFSGKLFKRPLEDGSTNGVIQVKKKELWDMEAETYNQYEEIIAIVADTPIVKATSDLTESPIRRLVDESTKLAEHVQKTFGPEGLRHVLGILVAFEENQRRNWIEWDVNKHLKTLGYKKKANGDYDTETRRKAHKIIDLIDDIAILAIRKDKNSQTGDLIKLFRKGSRQEVKELATDIIKKDVMYLISDPHWYNIPIENNEYVKILKKLVQENHQKNWMTIYITSWLSLKWRLCKTFPPTVKISIEKLFAWCNLDSGKANPHRMRDLKALENELDYMKSKDYLGDWRGNGNQSKPSNCKDPWNCTITLFPPRWLEQIIQDIKNKRESFLPPQTQHKTYRNDTDLTLAQFTKIFEASELKQEEFAKAINLSTGLVSGILNSRKGITRNTAKKIEAYLKTKS